MSKITFEIVEHLADLSENASGWMKEVNLVSWNGRAAKYDIRELDPEHQSMSKGITLTEDEMRQLIESVQSYLNK